jgi:hypothetical protein
LFGNSKLRETEREGERERERERERREREGEIKVRPLINVIVMNSLINEFYYISSIQLLPVSYNAVKCICLTECNVNITPSSSS